MVVVTKSANKRTRIIVLTYSALRCQIILYHCIHLCVNAVAAVSIEFINP